MKIAILGAGSFGTALATVFAYQSSTVVIWSRSPEVAESINSGHRHPTRFNDVLLAPNIRGSDDLKAATIEADLVVSALPMSAIRPVFTRIDTYLNAKAILLSTTKGIEQDSLMLPSDVMQEAMPYFEKERLVVLSGPNFASEIVKSLPWAAVLASTSQQSAQTVETYLKSPCFRSYYSADVSGVQLGGALKNVFAIAAGICDGMNLGCNARAALTTRSLAEMARFATAIGAEEKTVYGLSGLGDLLLSCTSAQSRNWRLGNGLALGKKREEIESEMGEVVEGVGTTLAAKKLSEKYRLDAPICDAVYSVLFSGVSVEGVLARLMKRGLI